MDNQLSKDLPLQSLIAIEEVIMQDSSNKIIDKKSIKSKEGFEGTELIYINAEKNEYNIRKGFIVNGNLIIASVITAPDYKNNGNITKFFNSLTLYNTTPISLLEAKSPQEWKQFDSEYGGFSALYPRKPTANKNGDSARYNNEFSYEPTDNIDVNLLYQTFFFKLDLNPNEYKDTASAQKFLNAIKTSYLNNSRYKFLSDKQIIKDGCYGVEFKLHAIKEDILLTARYYVDQNVVLGARVYTATGNDNNENMMKFLNSLVIYNRDSLNDIARSKVVWSEFKPESGVFKIEMPGEPALNEQAIETNGIPVYHKYFNYFDDSEIDGRFTYEGYSAKIPKNLYDVTLKFVRNQLLHISSVGFIKNSDGALIYERPIEYENYQGVEVAGSLSNNRLYVKGRFFIVEDQLIAAYAVTTSDFEKSPNFDKYFNSLHFSKTAPKRTIEEPIWERVELKEVDCAAEFPGSPKVLNNKSNGIEFKGYHLKTDDNEDPNSDYIAQYSLIGIDPAKLEIPENAKEFLHSFVEGYYETVKGKLLKEEFIELNGYRGVAMTMMDATGSILISGRFFIVNGYRVSATVNSTPQFDDNANMKKFFSSITLPKD